MCGFVPCVESRFLLASKTGTPQSRWRTDLWQNLLGAGTAFPIKKEVIMSSGLQACYDADQDWHDLKTEADICKVAWLSHSREAAHAINGFRKYQMTGMLLIAFVEASMEVDRLVAKAREINNLRDQLKRAEESVSSFVKTA